MYRRTINGGYYKLGIDDIPYQALRVLRIVNAKLELNSVSVSFPRLKSLQLCGCHVLLKDLRGMIHGATQLAAVRLESIFIVREDVVKIAVSALMAARSAGNRSPYSGAH